MTDNAKHDPPDLHVLGTQLSKRILDAQARFAAIHKKCDHYTLDKFDGCVDTGRLGPHRQGVGFKKDGKTWKLYFVEEGAYDRAPTEDEKMYACFQLGEPPPREVRDKYVTWEELSQASLVAKSKAVKLLARLFTDMQSEHERRIQLVREALTVLDQLDGQLPPAVKEGK